MHLNHNPLDAFYIDFNIEHKVINLSKQKILFENSHKLLSIKSKTILKIEVNLVEFFE